MRQSSNNAVVATLPSGLKVACCRWPGARVEYCGAVILAGSRDDAPDEPGMAHFVEHTIFKGTEKRSSWHIINRMERVGGELNAYTSKEETVVYTAAPAGNAARALELISDLLIGSRFPQRELDKEREVVADEINSYLDSPADAVFDDFEDLIYKGSPLGHNILGSIEALDTFDSARCRRYLDSWYAADNMAIFYCGPASAERICALADKYFAAMQQKAPGQRLGSAGESGEPFDEVRKIGIHQAHTVMGCRVPGMYSDERYALALLTNILGGPGMNSLLNVALREKRGLVYSAEASTTLLTDGGLFTIYFGCDPEDTKRCLDLARKQISDLAEGRMTAAAFAAAKKQYIGQLAVAGDARESAAISAGRAALYHGRIAARREVEERIQGVTAQQLAEAASTLTQLSSLTLM